MLIRALPLLAIAGLAAAVDPFAGPYWDLRLGLGGYPGLDKAEYSMTGNTWTDEHWDTTSGTIDMGASHRFDAETMHSGFINFGLSFRGTSGNDTDAATKTDITIGTFAIYFGGGYSLRPNRMYTLEIGPRIAVGGTSSEEKTAGMNATADSGSYAAFDLSAANLFNITDQFQLGVTLGIASWQAQVRYPATGAIPAGDATYSGSGGYLAFLMGMRL